MPFDHNAAMNKSVMAALTGTYNSAGVGMSFKRGPGMISVTGKCVQWI
jgi:hypothetical protein